MSDASQARVAAPSIEPRVGEQDASRAQARAERRMLFADGLRGIAATWVVLFHLAEGNHVGALRAALPRWLDTCVFAWGHGGVGIFFVLSGFVMALTVDRASMDGPGAGRFVLRRLVRLCPPYWLAIALYAALALAKGGSIHAGQWLANVLFLQGMAGVDNINIVFWTLCIEIQFYVAFAAMTWASDRVLPVAGRSSPRVIIALLALAWPLGVLTSPVWRGGFLPFWVFFMAGVIAFEGRRGPGAMRVVAGLFGAVLLGIGCQRADMFSGVAGLTCLALVASSLGDGMQTWLSARPLQLLGTVSYSLYLFHNAAIGIGFRILDKLARHRGPIADLLCSALAIAACIGVAWLAWFTIERASIGWSRSIRARRPAAATDGAAARPA
jgi:peptidoglycan/LPS O-acetylase OafA/YrhL